VLHITLPYVVHIPDMCTICCACFSSSLDLSCPPSQFHLLPLPPAGEGINRLDRPRAFYGYPYCCSEHTLPPPRVSVLGRQHAWLPFTATAAPMRPRNTFHGTPITNGFCHNRTRVLPPEGCLPAIWSPLGMAFQPPATPAGRPSPRYIFPDRGAGDATLLSHGSFSRDPLVGYVFARVRYAGRRPVLDRGGRRGVDVEPEVLFGSATGAAGGVVTFANGFRPLDGTFWRDGSFVLTGDQMRFNQ